MVSHDAEHAAGGDLAPSAMQEARRLTKLAVPIVMSLAAATLIGVVDTLMLAPLGTLPLAAASITMSVLIIFYSMLYGLITVVGVFAAHAYGARDPGDLTRKVNAGLVMALVGGVFGNALMIALLPLLPFIGQPQEVVAIAGPYWIAMSVMLIPFTIFYALKGVYESVDRAWMGVAFAFVAVAINVPANWLLIHVAGLGLLGAGLGSLLAQTLSLALAYGYWKFSPSLAAYRVPGVPIRRSEVMQQFREGLPLAIGYAGEGGAFAIAGLMMGWFGAAALASNQIVNSFSGILYMVPLGMATATSILVGQAIGEGHRLRVRRIGMTAIALVVGWMTAVMILLLALRAPLSNALTESPEVAALATTMFLIFALMQVADGVQATALGALRGLLDSRWPVVATLLTYWCLALPAAYVLSVTAGSWPCGHLGRIRRRPVCRRRPAYVAFQSKDALKPVAQDRDQGDVSRWHRIVPQLLCMDPFQSLIFL